MASSMARSVSRFSEKPKASISAHAPTRESGTETAGTTAACQEPRERKITSNTMTIASSRVRSTSLIESSIYWLPSWASCISMFEGNWPSMSGSSSRIALETVRGFAPGLVSRARRMAGSPLYQLVWS